MCIAQADAEEKLASPIDVRQVRDLTGAPVTARPGLGTDSGTNWRAPATDRLAAVDPHLTPNGHSDPSHQEMTRRDTERLNPRFVGETG